MGLFGLRFARMLPVKWQKWAELRVKQAGYAQDAAAWWGKTVSTIILFALLGAGVGALVHPFLAAWVNHILPSVVWEFPFSIVAGALLGFIGGIVGRLLRLYYDVETRKRKVEEVLPDFLMLIAGNIRAGMTTFSAFKTSSRPEFGPLSEEIRAVSSRSLGTESFGKALSTMSDNIQSPSLVESVRFFLQAIRSGGKMAQILENTSSDLRRTQELRKELESSVRTYVIFVAFVMMIATPLLMAVSVEFVSLITRIQSQTSGLQEAGSSALGFLGGTLSITPEFLEGVAYILLLGNAILAGLFMGTIGSNKPLLGLRYFPAMLVVSLIVFFVARIMLSGLLGTAQ